VFPAYGWFDGFAGRQIAAFSNGVGAVVSFFVLSGFVLARSLDANSNPVRVFRARMGFSHSLRALPDFLT
jgi:peptidoglycan/LPS O-acetylase OafA/YrhL